MVKMEGLADLERALMELPRATSKATLRRVLKKAAAPVEAAMVAKAPRLTGALQISIRSGTKLPSASNGSRRKRASRRRRSTSARLTRLASRKSSVGVKARPIRLRGLRGKRRRMARL